MSLIVDRRAVLQAAGALIVTFSVAPGLATAQIAAPQKSVSRGRVDGFLAIDRDGKVTVYSGKVELGTGVRTALTQIVAEELDVPLGDVTVVEGDTALTPDQGPTSGSFSIQKGGVQLRAAAATARQALLQNAAASFGVDKPALTIRDGVVIAPGGQKVPLKGGLPHRGDTT
jgi:nicotinate dehydrogenase subunit B